MINLRQWRIKRKFPREINRVWFAGAGLDMDKLPRYLVPYWDKNKRYIRYSIGDIVPMLQIDGYIAYYKIVRFEKYGSDLAGWDDGRWYDLKFFNIKKVD